MSVRKRTWTTRLGEAKSAWVVDYFDQHGRRHIETFARKRDAAAREPKVKVDIGKGMHVAPSESPTVAEAAQQWLDRVEANQREQATYNQYERHVRLHIVPHLGSTKLAKLTPAGIEKYRNEYLAKLSRALAQKVLTSLKSLLKSAKFAHVAADVTMARVRRERRLEAGIDFPDAREIKRLLAAATTAQQRALLLTAALTGLRASELRGLRWSDVELEIGELHVRQRADQFAKIGMPKSEAGSRRIPLAPELVSALREWKVACPINRKLDLVFPSSDGEVEHHYNMLRVLATLMRAAGVVTADGKPKYAMHAFRHFFASWSINPEERGGRGLPAKVVQDLLGHSSIVMTLDTYGHLFPRGDDRAELAKASRLLLGA